MCEMESMLSVSALGGGGWLYKRTGPNTDPLTYRHPCGRRTEITARPRFRCVYNPHHYLPSLLSSAPAFHFAICLFPNGWFHSTPDGHNSLLSSCARSTVPTTTRSSPSLHNSNGQKPLLVLTGLDDLGFAHTVVTQISVVFMGLCD